jgi:hypothetical protein
LRVKGIDVAYEEIGKFLRGELRQAISNAPRDMRVIRLVPRENTVRVICESEKWPEVEEGHQIPEFELIMRMPGTR